MVALFGDVLVISGILHTFEMTILRTFFTCAACVSLFPYIIWCDFDLQKCLNCERLKDLLESFQILAEQGSCSSSLIFSVTALVHSFCSSAASTIHILISACCFMFPTVRTGLEGPGLTIAQKIWYCIGTVGGQYIWARLQSFSAFRRWGDSEPVLLSSMLLFNIYIYIYSILISLEMVGEV